LGARERGADGREPEAARGAPSRPEVLAGRYAIESRLGAGGMGTVLLATDLETGRHVVLKRVHARIAERRQVVDRLLRGARVARSFSGRYIARVLDSGVLQDGVPFVVTDYLEGCDLRSYLQRRGPLRVKEAVKYLLQICEAVAEGHAAGVLHRDLKPENLFLALGESGTPSVKVLDFGTSAVACGVESEGPNAASGAMRSSLLYMAPEQMRSAGGIDERADIWSLGAVGYTLVCGAGPFDGPTELEICTSVLNEPPAPIPARIELGGFERVLLRCLDKEPEQRFANVSELALALSRHGGEGAQGAAERVWELLHADETVRMDKPVPSSAPIDSAELAPDTVPAMPELLRDSPASDAAPDTPRGLEGSAHLDDTLVSRYPDAAAQVSAAGRRSGAPMPQVVLLSATEMQRGQAETERKARAAGVDVEDNEVTRRISVSPGSNVAPAPREPAAARAPVAAEPAAARPAWRRLAEVLLVAALFAGLLAVWLVRGRVIDTGRAGVAQTGAASRVSRAVRAGVDAWRAGEPRSIAPARHPEPTGVATAAGAGSGRPPLVPPPGGWRYEELPPESIYDEVERERRRRGE
jgi:eukaryotic-like serine/threonine-protein kinase